MKILITGFGPFRDIKQNISWEAVRQYYSKYKPQGVDIHKMEVVYSEIERRTKEFGAVKYDYTIHLGHSNRESITLEELANGVGYNQPDELGLTPKNNSSPKEYLDRFGPNIETSINLSRLIKKLKHNPKISKDAGRYCCEYIYYLSLCEGIQNKVTKTLFIHLPGEDKKYTVEMFADFINSVVEELMKNNLSLNGKDSKKEFICSVDTLNFE